MMKRELFVKVIKAGVVAFLLYLLLFAGHLRGASFGVIGSWMRELTAILLDPETQWMAFLCLGVYFTAFLYFRWRASPGFCRAANPDLWLASGLVILAALYAIHHVPSAPALTLLGGAVLGQGIAFWVDLEIQSSKSRIQSGFGISVVAILVIFLTWASAWHASAGQTFQYRSQARWNGLWDNPNIFGLLMATGVMLALGLAVASFLMLSGKVWKWFCALLCLLAAILMARGLLHSYSRGAWLGAVCGGAYLLWHWVNRKTRGIRESEQSPPGRASGDPRPSDETGQSEGFSCGPCISRFKRNWLPLAVILASAFVLVCWHFRGMDWHPAQRAFSAINTADFSWRNRIAAWKGALQITAEHQLSGVGWSQPQPFYGHYYLQPKLTETGAIEMNDCLVLATTLGIPALFCFGMYLWLSLKGKAESGKHPPSPSLRWTGKAEIHDRDWLRTVCHAGAIALLIGFWFDGGLFKLPTAATFWILLELGNVRNHETSEELNHE